MCKRVLMSGLSVALAFSGLAACTKDDNEVINVYRVPSPIVVRSGFSADLKSLSGESNKAIDLHDYFDVTAAKAAKAEVNTRCTNGELDVTQTFAIQSPDYIYPFQIIPDEFLLVDLTDSTTECFFTFILSNDQASRHVFPTTAFKLTESQSPAISIDEENRIRFGESTRDSSRVICTDIALVLLPSADGLNLADYDDENPVFRTGHPPESIVERPLQFCRVIAEHDGQIAQISSRFQFRLPYVPLELEQIVPAGPVRQSSENYVSFMENKIPGLISQVVVRNTTNANRRVEFPKTKLPAVYDLYFRNARFPSPYYKASNSRNWVYFELSSGGINIEDHESYWSVIIPPQNELIIDILTSAPPNMNCRVGVFTALDILFDGNFTVSERYQSGELIETLSLRVLGHLLYQVPSMVQTGEAEQALISPQLHNNGLACDW